MKVPNPSELFANKPKRPAPVAEVEGMLRTNTPEDVIKSRLTGEGYTGEEVGRALDQAKAKIGVLGVEKAAFEAPTQTPPWQSQPDASAQQPQAFPKPESEFPKEQPGAQGFPPPGQTGPAPAGQAAPAPAAQPGAGEKPAASPWEKSEEELAKEFASASEAPPVATPGAAPGEPGTQVPAPGKPQAASAEAGNVPPWETPAAQPSAGPQAPPAGEPAPTKEPTTEPGSELKANIDEFKDEIDGRFTALEEKLETISKNGKKLETILTEIEAIKEKYTDMTSKTGNFDELEKDLDGMKEDVNNILEVLKSTFPPIIKALKELKGPSRRRKEVEHLL